MKYQSGWSIPEILAPISFEGKTHHFVGISLSDEPLIQVILISSNQEIRGYFCTDLTQILAENKIYATDKETVDQILKELRDVQAEISNGKINFTLSEGYDQINIKNGDFSFMFPLRLINDANEKILIIEQLLWRFIRSSALESAILAKDDAEIANKNMIITKLLVDHIHNSSSALGLDSTNLLNDEEIYNHESVKSLFLTNSGLWKSLSSTSESVHNKILAKYSSLNSDEAFKLLGQVNYSGKLIKNKSKPIKRKTLPIKVTKQKKRKKSTFSFLLNSKRGHK